MQRLIAKAASGIATDLEAQGYEVDVSASRKSSSRYVYATSEAGDEIAIRISDHPNPAHRWDRVSHDGDRAEVCHIEVRLDRYKSWKWAVGLAVDYLAGRVDIDPNRPIVSPERQQHTPNASPELEAAHDMPAHSPAPWPARLEALRMSHPDRVRAWEEAAGWRRKELRRELEVLSFVSTLRV
jgi:hypothetical protein